MEMPYKYNYLHYSNYKHASERGSGQKIHVLVHLDYVFIATMKMRAHTCTCMYYLTCFYYVLLSIQG